MSLLKRIAISNGNQERKVTANQVLAAMDQRKVVKWNKLLEVEAYQKEANCYPAWVSSRFIQGGNA